MTRSEKRRQDKLQKGNWYWLRHPELVRDISNLGRSKYQPHQATREVKRRLSKK